MLKKKVREKGKLKLSKYFKEFKEGDRVALVRAKSNAFPEKFQGSTGQVVGKKGNGFVVKFLNGKKLKTLVVRGINLKKLK